MLNKLGVPLWLKLGGFLGIQTIRARTFMSNFWQACNKALKKNNLCEASIRKTLWGPSEAIPDAKVILIW